MVRVGCKATGLALVLAIGAMSPNAWGQAPAPKNQYLLEAERRARKGQAQKCLQYLEGAAMVPENPRGILRDIQGMRAVCLRMVKPPKPAASNAALDAALQIDPSWRPPDWVPDAVRQALAAHRKAKTVRVVHTPIFRAAGNRPVVISARVIDPDHQVARLFVAWRLHAGDPYTEVTLRPGFGAGLQAFLTVPDPGDNPVGYELDYYVAAADASGKILDESGSPANPHRLQVVPASRLHAVEMPPPPPKPKPRPVPPRWYQHWWVWAIAGVAVAAGGVGIYSATRPVPTPQGSLGSIPLPEVGR